MNFKIFHFCLLFSVGLAAQENTQKAILKLASEITSAHKTKDAQARAAFEWVANNIRYDIDEYEHINFSGTIRYDSEAALQKALRAIDLKIIHRTWQQKASVCEGYALLYKELCDLMNIECVIVKGYTKTQPNEIGTNRAAPDHTWNAVKINGMWKLVDATWAAGYFTYKGWVKGYNEDFYNIQPERAILTHYPQDSQWQLLKNNVSKKAFFSYPVYYSHLFFYDVALVQPKKGTLQKSDASKILLRFKSIPKDKHISYAYSNDEFSQPLEFTIQNNEYVATIPVKEGPYLTLFIDGVSILDFKII